MLLLIFLAGFLLLSRITLKNSLLERLGFALPTGLASITLVMILMDWGNIGLTRTSLSIATAGVLRHKLPSLQAVHTPSEQLRPRL